MKSYGTHRLVVYADFVHLFGENINIITKNVEAVVVGLKVNTEKT